MKVLEVVIPFDALSHNSYAWGEGKTQIVIGEIALLSPRRNLGSLITLRSGKLIQCEESPEDILAILKSNGWEVVSVHSATIT